MAKRRHIAGAPRFNVKYSSKVQYSSKVHRFRNRVTGKTYLCTHLEFNGYFKGYKKSDFRLQVPLRCRPG